MTDAGCVKIFLGGDLMTGRGIDQALPFPGDPILHQSNGRNAEDYLRFAEEANGPIPHPADFSYIWGDAIKIFEKNHPDLKVVNLETSITASSNFIKGKPVHYKMNPGNISCLKPAGIDICALANNHILDWGYEGLFETLDNLKKVKIKFAGAGCSREESELPAVWNSPAKGRVIVFSFCCTSGGAPLNWEADERKPGINLISDLSGESVLHIKEIIGKIKQKDDIAIASIHWGGNWGYDILPEQQMFAHALINNAGVDLIHGHSSHHPLPIEVYKEKLIIYGAGDLINDYEGLKRRKKNKINWRKLRRLWKLRKLNGHKKFRSDLVLMYFASVEISTGKLANLKIIPMQIKKFRLNRISRNDMEWLRKRLNKVYKKFNLKLEPEYPLALGAADDSLLLTR